MKYTSEQIDEINALLLFDLKNPLDGIKAHSNAAPEMIAALQRLHDKGLVTQTDGGYLTDTGTKAAEHCHALLAMLK